MDTIRLRGSRFSGNTIISNCFIDNFLSGANEAQLKIYLYLTRCISSDIPVDVSSIADRFNYTEKDVCRALLYWSRAGIITLDFDADHSICGITLNDPADIPLEDNAGSVPVSRDSASLSTVYMGKEKKGPVPHGYNSAKISSFAKKSEVRELVFAVESYLRQTLSRSDMESILFMYDELHFDTDLIEFLVEHCIDSGGKTMKYFMDVALAWNEKGIKNVSEAREYVKLHSKNVYALMKEFGITDRSFTPTEYDYLAKWENEYGFDISIIKEAARRTIKNLAKPNFTYADRILSKWFNEGVKDLSDIEALDREHSQNMKSEYPRKKPAGAPVVNNRFKNFSERDYDMDALEKELTEKSLARAGKLS
ncbi:MAG: DnaD domain protein [Lachnospiraceae bacterium]|nr:DnaD domain protein [Lachnospiraceae bacterium]